MAKIKKYQPLIEQSGESIFSFIHRVKRPAQGELPYDYLTARANNENLWDWDGFFAGVSLATKVSSEAVYLKNWTLNFLRHSKNNGFSPACVTAKGRASDLQQMKPFIAQGAYLASRFLGDFSWLENHYERLKMLVLYRENNLWDKEKDLAVWYDAYESGASSNVAISGYDKESVIATDLNTFVHREYKAMSLIADQLGFRRDREYFGIRSRAIWRNINYHLWDEEEGVYYNFNRKTGKHIKRVCYNSIIPLWEKIASKKRGRRLIKKFLLSYNKLWAKYGVRTLSKDDPNYNNRTTKRFANWQGPVWPIVNYFAMHALLNYKFQDKAILLAEKTARLLISDINKSGNMHQYYHADKGTPLAGEGYVGWNLLVGNMVEEAVEKKNPFAI